MIVDRLLTLDQFMVVGLQSGSLLGHDGKRTKLIFVYKNTTTN